MPPLLVNIKINNIPSVWDVKALIIFLLRPVQLLFNLLPPPFLVTFLKRIEKLKNVRKNIIIIIMGYCI